MRVWVIDTSSVIELRQIPHAARGKVLAALDNMVELEILYFPPEVLAELERYEGNPEVAYTWAKKHHKKAARHGHLFDQARAILARVPKLIDEEKVSTVDEADPYVIAVALALMGEGHDVTVISDDTNNARKISLCAAAGVFRLPAVPLKLFLSTEGIWTPA